jgi:hypothetical protein
VSDVLSEVAAERARQDAKWGPPDPKCPDGTGAQDIGSDGEVRLRSVVREVRQDRATAARLACEQAARDGRLTFRHILNEEVAEAIAEDDPALLRAELVQIAAVAVKWCQAIDAREVAP